ncbi:Gamma-tubulin complex component 2 homolog [Eumeta japonica]|uniref:Gamma-tubulin complex component 2 homolog n=1 Tax=Eumeta variegata TaxID=151549 RepID=A0A4C1T0G4_EUMVA|nr:Gamma-tubulin complex component 2 homolog [Eumeta japonica]
MASLVFTGLHACHRSQVSGEVNNVDEVLERHNDFLEACLFDCMLNDTGLLQTVTAVTTVCVQFCHFMQKPLEGAGSGNPPAASAASGSSADSFEETVARYGLRFTAALLSVLAIIQQSSRKKNANKLLNISASWSGCAKRGACWTRAPPSAGRGRRPASPPSDDAADSSLARAHRHDAA